MTHPTNDELLDFHYDELDAARAETVDAHVRTCTQCRTQLATWRGVGAALGAWELPEPKHRVNASPASAPATSRLTWLARTLRAAAAVFLLIGTGYGLARFNTPTPPAPPAPVASVDTAALRAEVARDVRRELGKELRDQQLKFAADVLERQQAFQETLAESVTAVERRQVARHAALRRDVETVAIHAQKELNQLAYSAHVEAAPDKVRDQ
jgi:hypothetical protein